MQKYKLIDGKYYGADGARIPNGTLLVTADGSHLNPDHFELVGDADDKEMATGWLGAPAVDAAEDAGDANAATSGDQDGAKTDGGKAGGAKK